MYETFSCEQATVGVTEYLEGALPRAVEEGFERHLRTCEGCRCYLRQIRWTIDRLAAIPKEPMPPRIRVTLLQALHRRQFA